MTTEEKLEQITNQLKAIYDKERKSNGVHTILWLIQALIIPALAWTLLQVAQINGNRYTIQDGAKHHQEHAAHDKEHIMLERERALEKAKLAGLPPAQIQENKNAIKEIKEQLTAVESTIRKLQE